MSIILYMPNRRSLYIERARQFFQKAKDFVLPEFVVPALAGVTAGAAGVGNHYLKPQRRLTDHLSLFDTGPAPKTGTPSRELMDWKTSPYVVEAGDARDPHKLQLDFGIAQTEVKKILEDVRAVHPYISAEAAMMYNNVALVRKHLWHIVIGSLAEDYAFMPGESIKDINANPKTFDESMARYKRESGATSAGFLTRILCGISRMVGWFVKDPYSNPVNRPYWAHFFKLLNAWDGEGLVLLGGEPRFQSALQRMMAYWKLAANYYAKGDTPRAFCALGHAVHLVQDLHVPAHVHNDPHGPTIFFGKLDSFESWTARKDDRSITRGKDKSNASGWDSRPITPPVPDTSWNKSNISMKLTDFAVALASNTQKYRSRDVPGVGTEPGQNKTGALTEDECKAQAKALIPAAIKDSAQLIVNFVDYVRRNGEPVPA